MDQLCLALRVIHDTTEEFGLEPLSFKIEGHTAPTAKSKDGGMHTSTERSKAVAASFVSSGLPSDRLFAVGFGSSIPPSGGGDPRRVEIHVMTKSELRTIQNGLAHTQKDPQNAALDNKTKARR
jgi:flagellar motor protein MotB